MPWLQWMAIAGAVLALLALAAAAFGSWRWNQSTRALIARLQGEVAWVLPAGARPYWRGATTALAYEFAQ